MHTHLIMTALLLPLAALAQQPAVHFDMNAEQLSITSALPATTAEGIDGKALRFDGYSLYATAPSLAQQLSTSALTVSCVLAAETYPMMGSADGAEAMPQYAALCGNLDEANQSGFALELSSQGQLRLRFGSAYSGGYIFTVEGNEKLSCGQWHTVAATLDVAGNVATLYLDGQQIGSARMGRAELKLSDAPFIIGKSQDDLHRGPFLLNAFCGLIDDIALYNEVVTPEQVAATPLSPDFRYPASRYSGDLWRPYFHGMPSGAWTNECHGMTWSNGRYHLFFQKNANGPYMGRLHWGHISSADLCTWQEEPIALAPSESYDIKGCWSGCVVDDKAFYTAVDNARATIATATSTDADRVNWQKTGIAINGRPAGLSDDFRDPYFFTTNGEQYIIVGSSKDGIGCCTLHRYQNGEWTNTGDLFFRGTSAATCGTFWEMPNITPMSNGQWLFTCTPLNTSVGVRTLCWTGTIDTLGHFVPSNNQPFTLEMNGISKDGYGLLSPTIYNNMMLGIVPDKLPGEDNYRMGWAHCYSLPREIALDGDGSLIQKPFSGLTALRGGVTASYEGTLTGNQSLAPVSGRHIEVCLSAKGCTAPVGIRFLSEATLTYQPSDGTLTLNLNGLARKVQDGVYGGVYTATVPRHTADIKIDMFVDGSIADIFVNDREAFSVRLFPTDAAQTNLNVFAEAPTEVKAEAWELKANGSAGINNCQIGNRQIEKCYDAAGRASQHHGLVIEKGKKYVAR